MPSSKPADEALRIRQVALRYLGGRVRSVAELRAHLERTGASEGAIARAVSECLRRGLLDDAACAKLWAGHWARQGYAWDAIRSKLEAKGLDAQTVELAGGAVGGAAADAARARELLRRRDRVAPEQRARLLAARGFHPDLIEHLLRISPSE